MKTKTTNNPEGKRALVYVRVSTEKQLVKGTSLDSQESLCRAFAAKRDLDVIRVASEHHTGSELWERPVLNRERERIRSREYDALICYAVDRLTRDIAHLMVIVDECERHGVQVLFVTEELDQSPEGKLMQSVRGYVAEVERLKIRERMTRGKRQRVARGKLINASTPLYGYTQSKETSARTIKQSEAMTVRRIWDEAFAGIGMRSIAQKLNAEGVPSPATGKRAYKDGRLPSWGKSTIQRILREPAYAGLSVAYRWRHFKEGGKQKITENSREKWVILSDELTPAIVTPEEFDRMQALISGRSTGDAKRNEARPALLRGLIFCGRCGRRRLPDVDGYRCGSRGSGKGSCGSPTTPRQLIEGWAWEQTLTAVGDPARIAALLEQLKAAAQPEETPEQLLQQIETEIEKINPQQRRLINAMIGVAGDLAKMYKDKIQELETHRKALTGKRDLLQQRIAEGPKPSRRKPTAVELSLDQRIQVLSALGVKVTTDGRDDWRFEWNRESLPAE